MSKYVPYIAKRLNVEPGEWFEIVGYSDSTSVKFQISEDGRYITEPPMAAGSSIAILDAVECPLLVRKECSQEWTAQELEAAKAIKKLWPDAEKIRRTKNFIYVLCTDGECSAEISKDIFPSAIDGKSYFLDAMN